MTIVELPADLGTGYWQWRERVKRDPCTWCAIKPPKRRRTVEHVEPRSAGGPDIASNIVGACEPCNTRRSSTPLLLFLLDRLDA